MKCAVLSLYLFLMGCSTASSECDLEFANKVKDAVLAEELDND